MTTARDLARHLSELLRREHGSMADFLVALADFDRDRRWEQLGYTSVFHFLHRGLGVSKSSAHFRKTACVLVQRFPEVVEPLRDGRLCITSVFELARVITEENRAHVLPRFFHCSKQEARAVAVDISPAVVVPERTLATALAPLPPLAAIESSEQGPRPSGTRPGADLAPGVQSASAPATVAPGEPAAPAGPAALPVAATTATLEPRGKRDELVPVTRDRARFHVTVSRRFLEKLEAARAALSHRHPGASAGELLEAGLDLILAEHARRKGLVRRPRRPKPAGGVKVTAHVKREVWKRDGGRCQWPVEGGGVCGSTLRVELDHVVPKARGGKASVAGMRLLCRFHNQLAARLTFGDTHMDRFTRGRRAREPVAVYAPARVRAASPSGAERRAAQACLISCTSLPSDCFASPKSMEVFSA